MSGGARGLVAVAVMMLSLVGTLGGSRGDAASARASLTLTGAGSTFVAPLMIGEWIPGYTAAHPIVRITYAAVGSGAGITTWTAGRADFAASDALLTPTQEAAARGHCGAIVMMPVTISAVAIIFNVPGVRAGLRLSPEVIAGIFLGQITKWNAPAIQRLNPGVALPDLPIQTIHRSSGSGTTFILTSYLAAVSGEWRRGVGAGATVTWPGGSGASGSAGMVEMVSTTLGAIGYVDLAYAVQDNLDSATIQTVRGTYVAPTVEGASAAAGAFAASMPADLRQIIVNAPAAGAYPITGYSYVLLCGSQSGSGGRTLVDFVRYAVTGGQGLARGLYYAPLPASVQQRDTAVLDHIAASAR